MHTNPRRKRLWLALVFAGMLVVLAGWWYFLAQRPVGTATRANYEMVHPGMGEQEVTALLGAPGRYVSPWWRVDYVYTDVPLREFGMVPVPGTTRVWTTWEGAFVVNFDPQGEVVSKGAGEVRSSTRLGLVEGARSWLRRVTGR
jgi:hypothetical protein